MSRFRSSWRITRLTAVAFRARNRAACPGQHQLSATFAPAPNIAANASTSPIKTFTVVSAPTVTTVTLASPSSPYGSAHVVKVSVTASTPAAIEGTVSLLDGGTIVKSGLPVSAAGTATYELSPTTSIGPHELSARFVPSVASGQATSVSGPVTLTVVRVTPTVTAAFINDTIRVSASAQLKVTVQASGVIPTGAVLVYEGSTLLSAAPLVSSQNGTTTITLPKFKIGTNTVTVKYSGSKYLVPAQSEPVTVRVTN